MGDEEGVSEAAAEHGIEHLKELRVNKQVHCTCTAMRPFHGFVILNRSFAWMIEERSLCWRPFAHRGVPHVISGFFFPCPPLRCAQHSACVNQRV